MKKFLLLCFSFVFALGTAMAQDRVVSGKVTSSEDGSSLPGVNVVLKGTTNGTVTDADGNYKLSVPSGGGTLVFSFIGFATQEVAIGDRSVVDIGLGNDVQQLAEVVVTAQNISREKKALGYAVSSVGADQLAARPVNDVSRVLMGKVPGVQINPTGGMSGSGASINIRGYGSLTGNTQPLWVVDGVPFNSDTNNSAGFSTGGTAGSSSRFLDIDPNTIENISVLKGLAATVLYGDQGRNGVIVVTTKAGSGKKRNSEISFQQSLSVTEIASLPQYQNQYGNGFQQLSGTSPVFFSNWGPHFDEMDSTGHTYQFSNDANLRDAFPQFYFRRDSYDAKPNPLGFFRKGLVSNTSIGFSGGTDKVGFNASVGYTSEAGYAPGNDLRRLNIATGFNAAITDKLTIRSSLIYANTSLSNPPLNGATGGGASFNGIPSLYGQMLYTPRNIDVLNDPFETPIDKRSIYYRPGNDIPNPLWVAKYMRDYDNTERFFNSTVLNYDFNENMALSYKVGLDTYTQRLDRHYNKGIGAQSAVINRGIMQQQVFSNTIWNHDIIFSFNKDITSDIHMLARVGGNARNDRSLRDGIYNESQTVFGLMRPQNFQTSSNRSVGFDGRTFYRSTEIQRYGVYADVSLDYKNYLFLNLAARNDWISVLEPENNSLMYPSASVSFLPTEVWSNLKSNTLNSLKIRFSYGTSAGFPSVYSTRNTIAQNLRAFSDAGGALYGEHTVSDFLGNSKLRAELQQEIEAGFEAKLFNDKLSVDFTVYDRSTRDLITLAPIDPSTGYTSTLTNIGKVSNKGIELGVNATPIRSGAFEWNVTWNFTVVRPTVVDLGSSISEVVLNGFTNLGNFAIKDQPTNIIKGSAIAKDPNGNRIVGPDGLYQLDANLQILGDPNPKWNTTLINTLSYKGLSLMFQWDFRFGGKMYASTPSATIGRGVTEDVVKYSHDLTFVLPGVKNIGTTDNPNYVKNDIQITASDYGFNTQFFGYNEVAMFDATNIRLREVSLAYNLPKSLLAKTPFKTMSIQVNGNNLWFKAIGVPKYVNFDPEVSSLGVGQGVGFDYLTGPSVRRYGAVLKFTF